MLRDVARVSIFLVLLASVAPARAQNDALHRAYEAVKERTLTEYEFNMAGITRQMLSQGASVSKIIPVRERMKMLSYNRAVILAECAAESEKDRPPNSPPLPPQWNLVLTTCVEVKLGQLQRFSQLAAYADFFFPERIPACGEKSLLPDQEKMPPPYEFLEIKEPKLYDFPRYNECLMTRADGRDGAVSPASPAAQ